MKNKTMINVLMLLLIPFQSHSSTVTERALGDEITEATLIIKGNLISKLSKMEEMPRYLRNGEKELLTTVPRSIFTTFIFSIEEVLKGKYSHNNIKLMMLGGCDEDLGYCADYSFNYDYENGEKAVLFLKYNNLNKAYQTTQGSYTAFSINENDILVRKSTVVDELESNEENNLSIDDDGNFVAKDSITISVLKSEIGKLENNGEK